jgi:hypothetical protein
MYNPNQKPREEDRTMTTAELVVAPLEAKQNTIAQVIEVVKGLGLSTTILERQLQDIEVSKRTLLWLESFTDEEEKNEAMERVAHEGLPPEIFTSPENIHEGPMTLQ